MESTSDNLLFLALVAELRLPLLQIARLSESDLEDSSQAIQIISTQALLLVDGYSRAVSAQELALEPTNLRTVLQETAHHVIPYARAAGFTVEIDQSAPRKPVLTHHTSLQTMLMLLATSLMNTNLDDSKQTKRLVLAAHRLVDQVAIGTFSNQSTLVAGSLSATRLLHGKAQQAVPELGHSGTASLAIADRLSQQIAGPLKTLRHGNLTGIGSLLTPTRQLHFRV